MILPGKKALSPVLFLGIVSCAYFNTFYNAQQYFRDAEREILKVEEGSKFNQKTLDALEKVVQKCSRIVETYPGSQWWDDALILGGKALFYRGEFVLAQASFERLIAEAVGSSLVPEAELWALRCQWKLGYVEVARGGLNDVLKENRAPRTSRLKSRDRARGHEWLAELYLEQDQFDSAVHHYVESSRFLGSSPDRSRLYLKIADLAYDDSKSSQALEYYRQVIRVSDQPGHLERAHLRIVKITREQKKWNEATRQIQALLSDNKLTGIRPELHLELARLYELQSRFPEAMSRYTRITEEFPRTGISAEAYFYLGLLTLKTSKDYRQAKDYFSKVEKESRFSMLGPSARVKVKEIDAMLSILENLDGITEPGSLPDSSETPAGHVDISDSQAERLYSYGELLAFHFEQPDSGIRAFEDLVNRFPLASRRPQALFALTHLYREKGEIEKADYLAGQLVKEHPLTEYAEEVSRLIGLDLRDDAQDKLLQAERVLSIDPVVAVSLYREIVEKSPRSRYVPVAMLAIARTYDVRLNDLESSLAWYGRLIEEFPDTEQAAAVTGRYQELLDFSRSSGEVGSGGDSL